MDTAVIDKAPNPMASAAAESAKNPDPETPSNSPLHIFNVDAASDALWQTLVEQQRSDVFHSPAWARVLAKTYGFHPRARLLVDGAGKPQAGITYCRVEDMMDERTISLPFSDFCDVMVANQAQWQQLMGGLLDEGRRIRLRCLHNEMALADERFETVGRARWHGIDLQRDEESLWQGLHSSARRAIRKAREQGVSVRRSTDKADLRAFYEMHFGLRKYKYQLLAQPYRFFEHIWDEFIATERGALMVAVYENQVIGGVLFLEWQKKLYYKFNASHRDFISLRPNDLVIWDGMKYGCEKGYEYFDFGLSDWDQEGLLRFKRKFATEEKTITLLQHLPPGLPTPKEVQMRQLLPQLTDLFVDESVPDHVTEKAGNILYGLFT